MTKSFRPINYLSILLCLSAVLLFTPRLHAGGISGTVTSTQGGNPLGAVEVTAYQYYDDQYYGPSWDSVATASTNSSGIYSIGGLEAGIYRLRFRDTSGGYITEYYDDVPNVDSATDITVGTSQTVRRRK